MDIWAILKSLKKNYLSKKSYREENKSYSLLTGKKISDKEHGLQVWNKSRMRTMKDYHDLYLLNYDFLLLADVSEK